MHLSNLLFISSLCFYATTPLADESQPLCAAPQLDSELNIQVACYQATPDAIPLSVTLGRRITNGNQFYPFLWELTTATPNIECQPAPLACASVLRQDLSLEIPYMQVFGQIYRATLQAVLDADNDLFWAELNLQQETAKIRFANFNAALNRSEQGALITDLSTPDNEQAKKVAEIIQRTRPEVLALLEFDYDATGEALRLFQQNYLSISQRGATAIEYPFVYAAPSNTGVASGVDFDNNDSTTDANDAYGFGFFPGQYAFAILSQYPIQTDAIRTFQNFRWQDMPDAKLPKNPDTGDNYYSAAALDAFRLSSKNHVDVPIELSNGTVIHALVAHPTPPVFDGDEDRNGLRNHDEIRLFADYVTPGKGDYLYDDNGQTGGLAAGSYFVIMGDMNADPFDGDSSDNAALQLTQHPQLNAQVANGVQIPSAAGGAEFAAQNPDNNAAHQGNPRQDTAAFGGPGGLRVDYVLPSANLDALDSGIFWPTSDDPLADLVADNSSSDHRLLWVDVWLSATDK